MCQSFDAEFSNINSFRVEQRECYLDFHSVHHQLQLLPFFPVILNVFGLHRVSISFFFLKLLNPYIRDIRINHQKI
jgi:hypothetical protein